MGNLEILKERLRAELSEYLTELADRTAEEIIGEAELIAAMKHVCHRICDDELIEGNSVDYLLNQKTPLRSVAEIYMDEESDVYTFSDFLYGIADRDLCAE